MLMRALLVLLVVLNAGVAAWWVLHADAPEATAASLTADVPMLQLVTDARTDSPAPVAAPLRCFRFGPFTNSAAFAAARSAIAREVAWTATGEEITGTPRAWRVVLPRPDRASATATAARIAAAGFKDYLVLPDSGADANTIALGRYRSESAARDRVATLATAGFPARAEPVGGRVVQWLDVAAPPAFAPMSATLGLTGSAIDCAGVPRDGRYTVPGPA
jgi:hypothetical protein